MHRLKIGTIPIPVVYIAEDRVEAAELRKRGIPYIIRPEGMSDEDIAKAALFTTLKSMLPYINWYKVLGLDPRDTIVIEVPGNEESDPADAHQSGDAGSDSEVADIAMGDRFFEGGVGLDWGERPLDKFIGDRSAEVSIEELQELHLLPVFLDDIATAIRKNLYALNWSEGYNKKRGVPLGNFDAGDEKDNLIILDISGSIPRGVSATMLTLVNTLKEAANAALIVTGSTSYFWDVQDEIPSAQHIRNIVGYGNESEMFHEILTRDIAGRHWGNVIVFGDCDRPVRIGEYTDMLKRDDLAEWQRRTYSRYATSENMEGTTVDRLLLYHTGRYVNWKNPKERIPGYANWVYEIGIEPEERVDKTWCKFMD